MPYHRVPQGGSPEFHTGYFATGPYLTKLEQA